MNSSIIVTLSGSVPESTEVDLPVTIEVDEYIYHDQNGEIDATEAEYRAFVLSVPPATVLEHVKELIYSSPQFKRAEVSELFDQTQGSVEIQITTAV